MYTLFDCCSRVEYASSTVNISSLLYLLIPHEQTGQVQIDMAGKYSNTLYCYATTGG